jgi:hypothetical protein
MCEPVFMCLLKGVRAYDNYFRLKLDSNGMLGFLTILKCIAVNGMLAYWWASLQHKSWSNVQVLRSGGEVSSKEFLSERTNFWGHSSALGYWQLKGVSWDAWKLCMDREWETFHFLGRGNKKDMLESARSYLKPWHHKIFRFGRVS